MRKLKVAPHPGHKEAYTQEEARAILRVGQNTMTKLIRSQRIYAIPGVGRRVIIPRSSIEAFLAGEQSGPQRAA